MTRRPAAVVAVLALALLPAGCGVGPQVSKAPPSAAPSAHTATCPRPTGPAVTSGGPPAATLPCLSGTGTVALNRGYGRPTVINLWASWCGPCRQELPEIQRYAATHPKVLVLTVDEKDERTAGVSFADDGGLTLPTLFDGDGTVLRGLGRSALPVTLLVTPDGHLALTYQAKPLTADALGTLVATHLGVPA